MKSFKRYITENRENMVQLTTKSGVKYHVHKDYAKRFEGLVKDLEDTGYHIHSMSSYRPDAFVAGTGRRSAHADGMAIDINPGKNPHTRPHHHNYGQTDMPELVTKSRIHKKHGLGWGGEWNSSKDTMHFSAHPREGGDVNWTPPDEKEKPTTQTSPEKPKQVSPTETKPEKFSLTPTAQSKPIQSNKPVAYDDGGATNAAATKTEPTPAPEPKQQQEPAKAEPQQTSGKSWSQVRAAAGYSARQSVTSDPELLNLYNKYKEDKMNENFEQFIKKKFR